MENEYRGERVDAERILAVANEGQESLGAGGLAGLEFWKGICQKGTRNHKQRVDCAGTYGGHVEGAGDQTVRAAGCGKIR